MGFITPINLLALISVLYILFLYILKQKHQPYNVSSLYLWNQVLKDIDAKAPWQKLRKSLLLFLQIGLAILLTLAIAKPFIKTLDKSTNIILIIDTSLSMNSTDVNPSRIELAKEDAISYIKGLDNTNYISIITAGKEPKILVNRTQNLSLATNTISSLSAQKTNGDIVMAIELAKSIEKQFSPSKTIYFGDMNLDSSLNIDTKNYKTNKSNLAITLLSYINTGDSLTALSKISNNSNDSISVPVTLYVDKELFDAKQVTIEKDSTADIIWTNIPTNANVLKCSIDYNDSLFLDNSFVNIVNKAETKRVYLSTDKNIFLEKALLLQNGIEVYKGSFDTMENLSGFDLYIFDNKLPTEFPDDGNILIFNPEINTLFSQNNEIDFPSLQKSNHPIMSFVDNYNFTITKSKTFDLPSWAQPVIDSTEGVLAFAGQSEMNKIVVFGFDIHNSDLPLNIAFPVIITNIFDWLLPHNIIQENQLYCGDIPSFNINPKATEVYLQKPNGNSVKLAPPFPVKNVNELYDEGIYTVFEKLTDNSEVVSTFAVNIPAQREWLDNKSINIVDNDENNDIINKNIIGTKALVKYFIILIILLLILEWRVYCNEA